MKARFSGGRTIILAVAFFVLGGMVVVAMSGSSPGAHAVASDTPPQNVVQVAYGDIRSVLVLDGVATPEGPVAVSVDRAATVTALAVRVGSVVTLGAPLFEVQEDGVGTVRITSPVAGLVIQLPNGGDRLVAGVTAAEVRADGFEAVATVDPSQLYRFYSQPASVRVQLDHGPAPFDCPFRSIGAATVTGGDASVAPVTLRCTIPSTVRVFAGVRLKIAATTAEAKHVLALPVEAVVGQADAGYVTVVSASGGKTRRDVKLGITDGFRVEIVSGLVEGEGVLDPPDTASQDDFAASPSGR